MNIDTLQFLRLLQLADSALPIGSTAHSFGLETLTEEGQLDVEHLETFLQDYVAEAGGLEAAFCRGSYRIFSRHHLDAELFERRWLALNNSLSAFKTARESRTASATLGRRFLQLVAGLEESTHLHNVLRAARMQGIELHYSTAFGLTGRLLGVDETATVLAYLQQSLAGLVSACQRLLPLGQSQASAILWRIKPTLLETASSSEEQAAHPEESAVFTPLLDVGSMRHPGLATRLFIS
ncbi:MAG: urease accessory protein UreF [Ktedonobacteraceae bacterium]